MSLRSFYEEAGTFFQWAVPTQTLSEEQFVKGILPSVHVYANQYEGKSDVRLNFLEGFLTLPIAGTGPDNNGIFEFDMAAHNTNRNLVDGGDFVDNIGTRYIRADRDGGGNLSDLIKPERAAYNQFGWDRNYLRVFKNPDSAATQLYVRTSLRLPTTGIGVDQIDTPTDVILLASTAAPDMYQMGIRWAIKVYQMSDLNMVQYYENLFRMTLDGHRRRENIITNFKVRSGPNVIFTTADTGE